MKASGDHDGTTVSVRGRAGRNNRLLGAGGATLAVTMIGLTYAAAPFYSAFCRATGYEGTPQVVKANTDAEGRRILRVGLRHQCRAGPRLELRAGERVGPAAHGQDRHGLFPRAQPHRQTGRGPRHFQREP